MFMGGRNRMKDIKMKRFATMSLSAMMVFSTAVGTVSALEGDNTTDASVVTEVEGADNGVALQEATTYKEGVTVVADENSKSGYTAHFVYNLKADLANKDGSPRSQLLEPIPEDAEIVGVNLVGSFRLHSSYEVGEDRGHSLLDYQPGDFAANVHPTTWSGEWTFENLEQDASGNYTISVPMISGAHYYYYQINYKLPGEDQVRTVSVDDPKNVSPCRANEANSDSETGDITHSIVYGKYSEKQGSTPNLDYMTPYEGSNKGTVQYVEYKGKIYYPIINPNADVPELERNIRYHDPRNYNLKRHMVQLSLYELHKLISPNNISTVRIDDYDHSMQWLKDASRLKLNPQIPRKIDNKKEPLTDWQMATFQTSYDPYQNPWHV